MKDEKPFRSQVIDGALEREEDRCKAAIRFEIPVTKVCIRSVGKKYRKRLPQCDHGRNGRSKDAASFERCLDTST